MDLLIPVADRTGASFLELKNSLRSIDLYLKNYDRVFIIGKLPEFINKDEIIHVPFKDNFAYCKERRIMEKVLFACLDTDISKEFVFLNDDYFFTKEIDLTQLKPRFSKRLCEKIPGRQIFDDYAISMTNTLCALVKAGLPDLYFDIHYPFVYDKELFPEAMDAFDWETRLGFVVKSLYGNYLKLEGQHKKDLKLSSIQLKFQKQINEVEDMFSTNDIIPHFIKDYWLKLYPEKSRFEL